MGIRIEELLASARIHELPRRTICRVKPSTTLGEVYRKLDEEHGVAVLVCEDDRLLGVFTERDILERTALEGDPSTPIGELMSTDLVTLSPDQGVADAIRTMNEKHIRHIPLVTDDGRAEGLIGGRDILRLIAEHHPKTVLNLPPRLDQQFTTREGG